MFAQQEVMGIELGNISFNDFDNIMQNRGYKGTLWHGLSGEKISYKRVEFEGYKKCEVRVQIDKKKGNVLNCVEIIFPKTKNKPNQKGLNNTLYKQYLKKLTDKYGQPDEDDGFDNDITISHLYTWRNTPFRVIILSSFETKDDTTLSLEFCPKND